MSGRQIGVALTTLLLGWAAWSTVASSEGSVHRERAEGWSRLDTAVPGTIISYALPRIPNGQRQVVLLIDPAGEEKSAPETEASTDDESDERRIPPCPASNADELRPLSLYRLDPAGSEPPVLLNDQLPHDLTAVDVVDLDGDGRDELLLPRDGQLLTFAPGDSVTRAEPAVLLEEPNLRWRSFHPRAVLHPRLDGWPAVGTYSLGRLSLYGPSEDSDPWTLLARVDLPLYGEVAHNGLRVGSADPRLIGLRSDGALWFGTTATNHGKRRLSTKLVTVSTSGETDVTECWARLPEPEEVLEQSFLVIDDQPILIVTTRPADKLSLFGEKRLRLYPVERDRSRLGVEPRFATDSRMNLWQEGTPLMVDVNADGTRDLVVGYWKGLKDDRIVLDVYLRQSDGSFQAKEKTTAFDVDDGDRSFLDYGRDLTGDGLPDLVLRAGTDLLLFPGLRTDDGKKLVSRTPRRIPLGEGGDGDQVTTVTLSTGGVDSSIPIPVGGRPRFADLDGDGIPELLFAKRSDGAGRGLFRIYWLEPPNGP